MSGNTLKFYWLFLLALIIAGTLISRDACAAKWDGKSPIWLSGACMNHLTFEVMDQMDKLDHKKSHHIEYVVNFQKGGGKVVAERVYDFSNPARNDAIYPDDFHLQRFPNLQAVPICEGGVDWQIYIDGVLNTSGVAGSQTLRATVNGHLINVKGK